MSTPLETIKNGILDRNWSLVTKGYKDMTGEQLLVFEEEEEQTVVSENPVPLEKKKRGRPKKSADIVQTVEAPILKPAPRRAPNSTAVGGGQPVVYQGDKSKTEARTQNVVIGKIPQFFSE